MGRGRGVQVPGFPARVVFLLEDLSFGGTQRQALELARHLDRSRFRVELWVLRAGDDLAPLARKWDIPVIWLARTGWVGPPSLLALWRRLRRYPPDLLMLLTVIPNIWGRIWGRLAGLPVIVGNCRGGAAPWRQHERWLWPLAHHLLCNSNSLRDSLVARHGLPPERLTVVPNGVDPEFFQPPPGGTRQGPPVLLSVARLVPDKDHDTLLMAFARIASRHPEAELWLVGDGPRRQALEHKAGDLALNGRVRFFSGQPDLRAFYHRAHLFVLSSVTEALPNVILEAMAAGLPIVATRVGGIPEVVVEKSTGLLVEPGDVTGLAAALDYLLKNSEIRESMGQHGRERVMQQYSLTAMVKGHEEVWTRLLQGSPEGGGL
jgi:glycosyltransferase involved in cell wall biosynthesis